MAISGLGRRVAGLTGGIMTELQHYRARCNHYRAILSSMIVRLEDDEHRMRDLIQEARILEQAPEYNSREWREMNGIPFT